MELIKRTIYRIMTTGTTTGCTGTCRVIIPYSGTGFTYNINIGLVQNAEDIGFFNAYTIDSPYYFIQLSGATSAITKQNIIKFESVITGGTTLAASGLVIAYDNGYITGTTITPTTINVTGQSSSRLIELRKYTITSIFANQYISGGTVIYDGVDYLNSVSGGSVTYYIGGIKYVDILTGNTSGTTFSFIGQGLSGPDFINKPIYKDPNKENIISNPKIYDDVFIVRQELSAFDKNYRLEYINNLVDLETYAGGGFFNIVNNT
jgi:hypothetical protein